VHLLLLTGAILVRRPGLYLWANVVLLNLYALILTWAQRGASARLLGELSLEEPGPPPAAAAGRAIAEAR
jgi:hypothetical protein